MKELRAICNAYRNIDFTKTNASLATVVRVRGSSYRSPGARMLITDNGKWVGSISGGCLEGDALRKARKVMHEKKCISAIYDTRDSENREFSINLGCDGIIEVLFEPIDPTAEHNSFHLFESLLGYESTVAIATAFSGDAEFIGKKFLLKNDTSDYHNDFPSELANVIEHDLRKVLEIKKSEIKRYEYKNNICDIFLEFIPPAIHLMIFGGGFDARPLSLMAKNLGWNVTVTDECVSHIAPIFFPTVDKLSLCDRKFIDRELSVGFNTACVLMSHNYDYDRDVLKKLIHTDSPYIGILGPKKRFEKMCLEFASQGVQLSTSDLNRIHAPVGIDVGAETPDEIAIAVIAEIMGRFSQRGAGYLKFRTSPIHLREPYREEIINKIDL